MLDPFARIVLALAVERLMVGILLDEDHRQQARPGKTSGDHVEGCRRLGDLLAGTATELLAHVLGHEPLPRNHVEGLGDVFADLGELAAATARTRGRCRVNDASARQMIGKIATRRFVPREALNLDVRRFGLGRILAQPRGEFLELQFQLVEQSSAALRARAELLAPHLGDHQLQVRDHRLGAGEFGVRFDQRRLQRIHVVGELIRLRRHAENCTTIAVIRTAKIRTPSR